MPYLNILIDAFLSYTLIPLTSENIAIYKSFTLIKGFNFEAMICCFVGMFGGCFLSYLCGFYLRKISVKAKKCHTSIWMTVLLYSASPIYMISGFACFILGLSPAKLPRFLALFSIICTIFIGFNTYNILKIT